MLSSLKNADPDEYSTSVYGSAFHIRVSSLLSHGGWFGKNVITFGANLSFSVHIDNMKKDIGLTDGLDDTTVTAEKNYFFKFY